MLVLFYFRKEPGISIRCHPPLTIFGTGVYIIRCNWSFPLSVSAVALVRHLVLRNTLRGNTLLLW